MRPKLGQHFLKDPSILQFEADFAQVKGKSVLEIGAGDGRLTAKLLSAGAAHVAAVEIDPRLAKRLRANFRSRVRVVEGDFLSMGTDGSYNCVVGNIPYYLTSPILLKLSRMKFSRAVLCLQKEVAERMVAKPGSRQYGRLSVFCQLCFCMKILADVGRGAFDPPPRVDSCIVLLEKTGVLIGEKQDAVMGALFSHRKKSVKNAVVDARQALFGSNDKPRAAAFAQTLKYAQRKVFTLTPGEAMGAAEEILGLA